MRTKHLLVALSVAVSVLPAVPARSHPLRSTLPPGGIELVGAFPVGAPLTGGALLDGFLYATTYDRLSIYDVEDPTLPRLVGSAPSVRPIYGELLSTDGETLLLNNGVESQTLEIWNVEDKSNPVLISDVVGVTDEHFSCLLDCSWAYGSNGSIVEIRRSQSPIVHTENWLELVGKRKRVHRIDEFAHGYMASAPREGPPQIIDVHRPLKPRAIATTDVPKSPPSNFLYSSWLRRGRDRFVLATGEMGICREPWRGALTTFDTNPLPKRKLLPQLDTFRYGGDSDTEGEGCSSYYFSLRPGFRNGGLVLLPSGQEGVRLVKIDHHGMIDEIDSFQPAVSDVWLSFWIDRNIFYALNLSCIERGLPVAPMNGTISASTTSPIAK